MNRPNGWTFHNLIGHPLSEILYLLGYEDWSEWVHDVTLPGGESYDSHGEDR